MACDTRPMLCPPKLSVSNERYMNGDVQPSWMGPLLKRLDKVEAFLRELIRQRPVKDWYSTDEVAEILGKAKFTVREWCRLNRVRAQKRPCGRGRSREWMIAHAELERIQNEGLFPQPTTSTRIR